MYPRIASDQEAWWAKGAGVRAQLTHLLRGSGSGDVAVSLSAAESAWVAARAAAGAGDGANAKPADEAVRAQAAAVQRRTVTGLYSFLFHSATSGSTQQAVDLTPTTIEAIVPDGAGGFETIPATARRADGTYAIAGVPEGPHWVRLGTLCLDRPGLRRLELRLLRPRRRGLPRQPDADGAEHRQPGAVAGDRCARLGGAAARLLAGDAAH
ncbi:MAG: hypothetical protein U1F67_14945 [Rubrivivax sp.]